MTIYTANSRGVMNWKPGTGWLRCVCGEAVDPGDDIQGSHRFSCGPRVDVVLKTVAVQRPDLLDRDGRPTDAIWAAFGAEVAAGDLAVMEDPHEAIAALRRFLESTVARALGGLTLDALYALTQSRPRRRAGSADRPPGSRR